MVQRYWIGHDDFPREIVLPPELSEVMNGLSWGRADTLDTPAYWALRCETEADPLKDFRSANGSLIEEIGFCLLGGFGITAELNGVAFERLKSANVFDLSAKVSEDDIKLILLEPLDLNGALRRYRFPNQRARRLTQMRHRLRNVDLESMTVSCVERLLRSLSGIGPKTAAWIIRNHFGSDDVAILDIHVIRACSRLRLFPQVIVLPRDYDQLQSRFLEFARAIGVRPSVLDAIMWTDMRSEGRGYRRLAA